MSISELKAHLSRYLREVRRGQEVQVLDRGVPVARLVCIEGRAVSADERRERLVRAGILKAGTGDASAVLDQRPLALDVRLREALEEDRADRS